MGLALLVAQLGVQAGEAIRIVGFDADQVEVRRGERYDFVAPAAVGAPPIAVEARDNRNFLKVTAPDGSTLWVNAADVRTDEVLDVRHNCSSLALSQAPDRKQYGMRGVGERCK